MYHCPWTTTWLMKYIVRDLFPRNQGNSWACLGCSWRPWCGMWGDSPLSDVFHASYTTHETVGYLIYTGNIILGPLYYWWGAQFKLFAIENQGSTWVFQMCSWRSFIGMWGDPPLSDVVHTSYITHKTVRWHVHNCIIILGPLQDWWAAWFEL